MAPCQPPPQRPMNTCADPTLFGDYCDCAFCNPDPEDLATYRPVETIQIKGDIL